MIQLSFHPAYDPIHTTFRLLRIREDFGEVKTLSVDHIRILDFFLVFPFRLDSIRLKASHRRFKKLAGIYAKAKLYGDQPEDRTVFNRMFPIQWAALNTLSKHKFINGQRLADGQWVATNIEIPSDLESRISQRNTEQEDLMEFLRTLGTYELMGGDGLKARTGLLEHRYDAL